MIFAIYDKILFSFYVIFYLDFSNCVRLSTGASSSGRRSRLPSYTVFSTMPSVVQALSYSCLECTMADTPGITATKASTSHRGV